MYLDYRWHYWYSDGESKTMQCIFQMGTSFKYSEDCLVYVMDYGGLATKMGLRDWILSIKTGTKKIVV